MSSTLLEVTRAAHEEVERLERLVVKDLQTEPNSNKDRLVQSHRVRNMIDTITDTTERLVSSLNQRVTIKFLPYSSQLNDIFFFMFDFRLRFTKIKTMLGKMKLLLLEAKLPLELMYLVHFTID